MNQSISLANYIDEWMNTYKAYSVRQSTFDRLLTSIKALEGYAIASTFIRRWIQRNVFCSCVREIEKAPFPLRKSARGRGRRTRTLNKGFGDPRVTITPCP